MKPIVPMRKALAWPLQNLTGVKARALGLVLVNATVAACGGKTASDDDVLKHVLAINTCYARMYVKQAGAALTQRRAFADSKDLMPVPTPAYDVTGLRACFAARVSHQRLNDRLRTYPAILALGRSCEKYVDLNSDAAIAGYGKCIHEGMPAALDSPR
ncbi:MAG TPA: hypothetical protein VIX83_07525 [Candidatus Cybelea sp.]